MRARYADLEGTDAIDGFESEETLLASETSLEAEELTAPATDTTYASSEDLVETSSAEVAEAENSTGGLYELYGFGTTIAILDESTYNGTLGANPYPDNEYLVGTHGNDVIDGGAGHDHIQGLAGDDLLLGGDGNDFISSDEGNDRMEGGDGDDFILGSFGDNVAFGDAGGDQIYTGNGIDHAYGGTGNDLVDGGGDNDYLDGGADQDIVQGGAGNDMAWGGDGDDHLDGGDGYDWLDGGAGNDALYGRSHGDALFGGAGDDVLVGDGWMNGNTFETSAIEGADTLHGGADDDKLYGLGGDDQLDGGAGNDILNGGNGVDVINGGAGSDVLVGMAGRDIFVFTDADPVPYGGYELDTIHDFEFVTDGTSFSGDWIDLRPLFDQYTTFTGTSANEAWAEGYLYLVQHGNPGEAGFGTTIYIDPNGHAPDYYLHDFAVVDLAGVASNQFDAFNQEAAFLSKYILA